MINKRISKELFLYIIAGALTTGVNFAVYYMMIYFNIDYKISNTAAFVVSVIFAFIANKKYVFLSDRGYIKEFVKFSAGRVFTYILDIGTMMILIEYFNVGEYMAKIWANVIVIFSNYFISKFWIFK